MYLSDDTQTDIDKNGLEVIGTSNTGNVYAKRVRKRDGTYMWTPIYEDNGKFTIDPIIKYDDEAFEKWYRENISGDKDVVVKLDAGLQNAFIAMVKDSLTVTGVAEEGDKVIVRGTVKAPRGYMSCVLRTVRVLKGEIS